MKPDLDSNQQLTNLDSSWESLTLRLQGLMQKVGINSFKELYRSIGTSAHTINKLRSGEINTLKLQTLIKISSALQITATELIETFSVGVIVGVGVGEASTKIEASPRSMPTPEIEIIQQEYQHLQQQLEQQRETLQAEFQYQSLQTLESFLTYFPTAKYAAQTNPDFPASKLFPLVGSIDRLISQWGVTVIGEIGSTIAYDPRWHQLIEGTATPDELVTVRYVGYRQSDKLIFRAKVSN
jgi:DNA-binding Xre family transcriptional regulator/molecular chaperone GrpE (heat shock protein)